LNKGDLFILKDLNENPKNHKTPLGICVAPWGWNSHGEKMYKVLIGNRIDVVTEKEIDVISNKTN
jgi:hypothetical protein